MVWKKYKVTKKRKKRGIEENMKYYLVMDIGGTKTSAALFDEDNNIVDDYVYTNQSKTFSGEDAVYMNSKSALDHIIQKFDVDMDDVLGIGVGCPGPLDTKTGVIINAPLMRWKNFPLVDRLKADYSKPVAMDNDCNVASLAEQRFGLAKGKDNVVYITISTGIGSGIMLNGKIYRGKTDSAGEFGHMSIEDDGRQCPCGNKGCLELYCSGTAIKDQMAIDAKNGVESLVFEMANGDEKLITAKTLSEAADKGDKYALDMFEYIGEKFGYGISNLFNILDPDVVVIGGGVSKSSRHYADTLRKTVKRRSIIKVTDDQILFSELCDQVVLYGASFLIKDLILKGEF